MEQEKKILDQVFKPDTKIELDLQQFTLLKQALQPFIWADAVLNDARNNAAQKPGVLLPVTEDDVKKDESGKILLNNGNIIIKDEFWEKHKPKENNAVKAADIKEKEPK